MTKVSERQGLFSCLFVHFTDKCSLLGTFLTDPIYTNFAQRKSNISNAFLLYLLREVRGMDMLEQLNAAVEYIEANLCAGLDLDGSWNCLCYGR